MALSIEDQMKLKEYQEHFKFHLERPCAMSDHWGFYAEWQDKYKAVRCEICGWTKYVEAD